MRLPGRLRAPLGQVVRDELGQLSRVQRAASLLRLTILSGFLAAPTWMTGTLLVSVAGAVASVSYPLGYRMMVDGFIEHDVGTIAAGAVVTGGIFALFWALSIIGGIQSAGLSDRVNIWLSTRMGGLLADIPDIAHFERPEYLAEVDLLANNRRSLAASPRLAINLLLVFARMIVVAFLLATVYPPVALLPLIGLFPLLGDDIAQRIQERSNLRLAEDIRLSNEFYGMLTTAGPSNELRVYNAVDDLRARFDRLAAIIQRSTMRAALAGFGSSAAGWSLYAAAFGGTLAILVVQAAEGRASVGDVVMAVTLIRRLQTQVGGMSDAFGQMITGFRLGRRLLWLETVADRARRLPSHGAAVQPPNQLADGIVLDRVSFAYPGTETMVLRDVSMRLPAGASVAVVGENGAGKSTLVKLLMKLYEPSAGQILVDGVSLAAMDADAWRARCTAAFQDHARFELRSGHIVGVGDLPRIDDEDAVLASLEAADGLDVVEKLDLGLATPVGRSFPDGRDLSGGQWQKLALGRAVFPHEPLLAVLDEPTASLDTQAEAALLARLARAARQAVAANAVTLFVSHRFPSARIADIILVIADGTVAEAGNHDELIALGGRYAEMFELQARAYR
jgi:ATP-binding cassette, subfamily B, bacterial